MFWELVEHVAAAIGIIAGAAGLVEFLRRWLMR